MAIKPVTEAKLKAAKPGDQISCGNGLLFRVKSQGSASFIGRSRHESKQVSVYIGVFGRRSGEYSLAQARERWREIRSEAKNSGLNPADIAKGITRKSQAVQQPGRTLSDLADKYLEVATSTIKEITLKDYKNKIENDILPVLGESTLIVDLEWANGGRERVLNMKTAIEKRGAPEQARRVLMVARQMFDLAMDYGWLAGENPAMKPRFNARRETEHRPTIQFEDLPKFFEDLEEAAIKPLSRLAVKMTMLTFCRVSAIARMQWLHLDLEKKLWTIPGEITGVKRRKGQEHIPHLVPLSAATLALIEELEQINSSHEYCFYNHHKKGQVFMNPSCINNSVRKMGYQGICTAHGLRALGTTGGIEVLGYPFSVMEKCLGHITGSKTKVQLAYDRAELMKERTEFMEAWGQTLIEQGMII